MTSNLSDKVKKDAEYINSIIKNRSPKVAVVLGSGLGFLGDLVQEAKVISYGDIPNFSNTSVPGHLGRVISGRIDGIELLAFQGRFHFYEGHNISEVVHPIRVMKQLGVEHVLLTNAAGGLQSGMIPGGFMLIEDHINFMGINPLLGSESLDFGERFPDMTKIYDTINHIKLATFAKDHGIPLFQGVYGAVTGPMYETPAEIRMYQKLGVDAIGMSTVPEAIAARHCGMKVSGVSCITNLGAGLSAGTLSHDEVKKVAGAVEHNFGKICTEILKSL